MNTTTAATATYTDGTVTVTWGAETVSYNLRKAPGFVAVSAQPEWVKATATWTPAPFWVTFHSREDLAARESKKRAGMPIRIVPVN
jgi:hypothetical protein